MIATASVIVLVIALSRSESSTSDDVTLSASAPLFTLRHASAASGTTTNAPNSSAGGLKSQPSPGRTPPGLRIAARASIITPLP